MKNVVNMYFDAGDVPGGAHAILGPAGVDPNLADIIDGTVVGWKSIDVYLELDEHDPRIAEIERLLAQYGLKPDMFTDEVYSDEDRQASPLLVVDPAESSVLDGPRLGTKYDMTNACVKCGAGARQTSPLCMHRDDLPKVRKHRAYPAAHGDILLDGGMKKKLVDNKVTGVSFGDVYASRLTANPAKNKEPSLVARDQVIATYTLPPLSPRSVLDRTKVCPVCHRGGYLGTPGLRYYYRRRDLEGIPDVCHSWEWFGIIEEDSDWFTGRVLTPLLLVTPKVMNIFRDAGVTTFKWTPIFVED